MKRVRITLEMDSSFIKLLSAEIQLDGRMSAHVTGDGAQLTPSRALAVVACAEARGGHEAEVDVLVPFEWRPHLDVIHEERRVEEVPA